MSKDISSILDGWDYQPGEITVRKIRGDDGKEKVQLRLDMGLLQMEVRGRPDGQRPHGKESLLHYFLAQLARHKGEHGSDEGFQVGPDDCKELRDEGTQYYYRYLSLYQLGDYEQVEKDTARNLEAFDLLRRYAAEESDRLSLEIYRPYVIMMNAKARGKALVGEGKHKRALAVIETGVARIEAFYASFHQEGMVDKSVEIGSLKRLAQRVRREMPRTRKETLEEELQQAIEREEYERAASLRDELRRLEQSKST